MKNIAIVTIIAILAAGAGALAAPRILDAWDFDDCWRRDRQNRHGYPVSVPDWCEPHGFTPRPANP